MWKKSKDGGLDYDVSNEFKTNPLTTAITQLSKINIMSEEIQYPTSSPVKKDVRERFAEFRRRRGFL